jgi:hypothetical protein
MSAAPQTLTFVMRKPCVYCRHAFGVERHKNGQFPVYCAGCGKYAGYLRPRDESGRAPRSVASSRTIKPRDRIRILERDGRCLTCGKQNTILHVSHVVSVKEALDAGETESAINADRNLFTECEECNLGRGASPIEYHALLRLIAAMHLSVADSDALQSLWKRT